MLNFFNDTSCTIFQNDVKLTDFFSFLKDDIFDGLPFDSSAFCPNGEIGRYEAQLVYNALNYKRSISVNLFHPNLDLIHSYFITLLTLSVFNRTSTNIIISPPMFDSLNKGLASRVLVSEKFVMYNKTAKEINEYDFSNKTTLISHHKFLKYLKSGGDLPLFDSIIVESTFRLSNNPEFKLFIEKHHNAYVMFTCHGPNLDDLHQIEDMFNLPPNIMLNNKINK